MSSFRLTIEKWFKNIAFTGYHHPVKTCVIMFVVILPTLFYLPKITIDTSLEGMLQKNDPDLLVYNDFRKEFGRDERIIVAIHTKNVYDLNFLRQLKALHTDIKENVPYVEEVTSLINARNIRGNDNQLIVEELFEHWPETPEDLLVLKNRISENPLYRNLLISDDDTYTTIIIKTQVYLPNDKKENNLDGFGEDIAMDADLAKPSANKNNTGNVDLITEAQTNEAIKAVIDSIETHKSPTIKIYLTGSPVLQYFLNADTTHDMTLFMGLTIVTISIFLYAIFLRMSGVVLPLLVVYLSLLSTIGIMAATGAVLKLPTSILPSFLLAVGMGDAVHILAIFFQHFNKSNNKEAAIIYAFGHSGLAILMTSITTAGGLLSLSTAKIAPIIDLGIYGSIGVLIAFFYTIFLLPALIALIPLKPVIHKKTRVKVNIIDPLITKAGTIAVKYPLRVLTVSLVILFFASIGLTRLRFAYNSTKWLPRDNPIRVATETIDKNMHGSMYSEIVIDTGKKNGLHDPVTLKKLDQSTAYLENLKSGDIYIGKAWSVTAILKEINRALNNNEKVSYAIPGDEYLISQEFLLFENRGSTDLEYFTDEQFKKARLTMIFPLNDAFLYMDFLDSINHYFQETFPDAKYVLTGMIPLFCRTLVNTATSMARSYIVAFIVISILMILLIGDIKLGILSMIPNLLPIAVILGIMGWLKIYLGPFNMLIGSIAIGLAVDDTIHFMHNFRKYYEIKNDPVFAVMEALNTAGHAMLITTCVLSTGFFIFIFASMNNISTFGMLTGFTLILALLADFFVAPALMVLATGGNNKRRKKGMQKNA
ncbi:MAG: MMPL family transporter [Proteobacteria bacterium]|nr:MMPL family transporter [Pseudomonadota bacterium]